MRINISDLKTLGSSIQVPVWIKPDLYPDLPLLEPIKGRIKLFFRGDKYVVNAELEVMVELECRRCLNKFPQKLEINFQEYYEQGSPQYKEGEIELQEEELNTFFFEGEAIDLSDSIRENILVSLPWNPLCSESCRGLCPTCGANLNFVDCQCQRKG
ncbi:MAG: YceD family protein [bacterium]